MWNGKDREKRKSAGAYDLREVLAQVGEQEAILPVDQACPATKENNKPPPLTNLSNASRLGLPPRIPASATPNSTKAMMSADATSPPPLLEQPRTEARFVLSGRTSSNHLETSDRRQAASLTAGIKATAPLDTKVPVYAAARTQPLGLALVGGGVCASIAIVCAVGFSVYGTTSTQTHRLPERLNPSETAASPPTIEMNFSTTYRELGLEGGGRSLVSQGSLQDQSAPVPNAAPPTPSRSDVIPDHQLIAPNIIASAGVKDIPWEIQLLSTDGPLTDLKIVVKNLPTAAQLSRGRRTADGTWTLTPTDLSGLTLALPEHASSAQLTVLLTSGNDTELVRLVPSLDVRAPIDSNSPYGKNDFEEKAKIFLQQGETHLQIGDVAGARMFFRKAANEGDAAAAIAMGRTYEPGFFATMNVQGMAPDIDAARRWYQRAIDLGSKEAFEHLERLRTK